MRKAYGLWLALGAAPLGGCATGPQDEPVAAQDHAIYGAEGDYEFAIDAPWRVEPTLWPDTSCPSCPPATVYGAIPIVVAIHDAHLGGETGDGRVMVTSRFGTQVVADEALGQFRFLRVTEAGFGSIDVPLEAFHEIERTIGGWRFPEDGSTPPHELCRQGQQCPGIDQLSTASEWHALLYYQPRGPSTPGRDVQLDFEVHATQIDRMDGDHPGYYQPPDVVLRNSARVHLAEAPLPRFDERSWAYGDLHYHSQGTDNEGESAYAYRGVVHAMGALGLDFAVASEHASNSEQLVDLDILPNLWTVFTEHFLGLRDMSPTRFAHLWDWLNRWDGANRQVVSMPRLVTPTRARVPQIYLGGEVDVVPENVANQWTIANGNGRSYDIRRACAAVNNIAGDISRWVSPCDNADLHVSTSDGRWLIRDVQGPTLAFARQHLVHLPRAALGASGFVASDTTRYGGGRYRLKDLIRSAYDQGGKGDFFLAHPLDFPDETGVASLGPDILPYSQVQLEDAFVSPHFLGLQLWNSDSRRTLDASFGLDHLVPWADPITGAWKNAPEQPGLFSELHHGTATWDRLLLMGLDPARTAGLDWLPRGEPRRVFMAGGSDAHGDLNFRRKGYMVLLQAWNQSVKVNDTAMGTPRNLVHTGVAQGEAVSASYESRPYTQDQVFAALARGEFSVTDGPALRLVWDTNSNGVIDDSDVPMGGAVQYDPLGSPPPLLVEWKSTAEFGPVTRVDLYVGAAAGAQSAVFAPAGHGVRGTTDQPGNVAAWLHDPASGRDYGRLDDGYWYDPTPDGRLRLWTADAAGMAGVHSVSLDPALFRVGVGGASVAPQQLYVRGFAMSYGREITPGQCASWNAAERERQRTLGFCIPRLAYTNPVWARPSHPAHSGTLVSSGNKCLDVLGLATGNGAGVGLWDCNSAANQEWRYDNLGQNFYGWAQKLLDALGWQQQEGATVGIWSYDGAWNQKWRFDLVEIHGFGGKNLDALGWAQHEGAPTALWDVDGAWNQKWTFTPAGEIRSWDNRCLDVYGGYTGNGTQVLIYTCYGTENQKWRVLPGGMLQGIGGKCLTVENASTTNGTRLVMWDCAGTANQTWALRGPVHAWNDKCLDAYGGYNDNGTPVLLYTCHGGGNQQWTYYP